MQAGLSPERVVKLSVSELDWLAAELKAQTRPGDIVFIKGSRALALERIVEIIKQAVN